MFDPEDNSYEYFGGTIGPELLECLSHQGLKTQIVGQAELLPCLVARIIWAQRTEGRAVIHYVDNEAARYALIKVTSPTMDSAFLTAAFWKEDSNRKTFSWFERVPSPSNPADAPSRKRKPEPLCQGTPNQIEPRQILIPSGLESDLAWTWAQHFGNESFEIPEKGS